MGQNEILAPPWKIHLSLRHATSIFERSFHWPDQLGGHLGGGIRQPKKNRWKRINWFKPTDDREFDIEIIGIWIKHSTKYICWLRDSRSPEKIRIRMHRKPPRWQDSGPFFHDGSTDEVWFMAVYCNLIGNSNNQPGEDWFGLNYNGWVAKYGEVAWNSGRFWLGSLAGIKIPSSNAAMQNRWY